MDSEAQRPAAVTSLFAIAKYLTGSNSVEEGIILVEGRLHHGRKAK